MKEVKKAWLNWSRAEEKWVLRLWIDNEWEFSKSWNVRNVNEETGFGFVSETVLTELAHLYDLGYEVNVTC